ncbi:MAG: lipocalin family protein [Shinella sp.]|uniref:lipocalin family protein n=1 Tax=Shinella sp. TaxID=1870904 RepID=UPI004036B722
MLSHIRVSAFLTVMFGLLFGLTTEAAAAPKVVQVGADHYRGTWLEIGRTPMVLTDGCVAGYSTYRKGKTPDEVIVEDGCHVDTPKGRLKTVSGTGKIEDFGTANAKMRVRYPLLITFNYWILYKSPDKSWFISANPSMTDLWIYSRTVPSKARLQRMVRKASELGYDVRKLEFPLAR